MFSESLDSSNEMAINIPVKEEKQDFSFEADTKVFSMCMQDYYLQLKTWKVQATVI